VLVVPWVRGASPLGQAGIGALADGDTDAAEFEAVVAIHTSNRAQAGKAGPSPFANEIALAVGGTFARVFTSASPEEAVATCTAVVANPAVLATRRQISAGGAADDLVWWAEAGAGLAGAPGWTVRVDAAGAGLNADP